MLKRNCSAMDGILLALTTLPVLVNGYDCRLSNNDCSQGGDSNLIGYSTCMVAQWSVSAFIQCASQSGVPDFTAYDDDGGSQTISPINILTNAVNTPACSGCTLASNLQKAAAEHGSQDFETYLCNEYHPVNAGLCCLKNCLLVMPAERSITAFCSSNIQDLMNAPTLPESCGSDSNDKTNNGDSSAATSSRDGSSPTNAKISPSSSTTQSSSSTSTVSSTVSTTSSTASNVTPTSTTSTSPTSKATPSTGAALGRRVTYFDRLNILGLTILPILAVF